MDLKHVARALADAMLSGGPDAREVTARCARTLGQSRRWLPALSRTMIALHGHNWRTGSREALARSIGEHPALRRAQREGKRLHIRYYYILPALMEPRPAALEECAFPDLPTPADLARWLGISGGELDWLTGPRAPLRSDHYAYRCVQKRSGGWRLIEMPKARLRTVQRKLLRGLLEYIPPHQAAHGFRARHSILTHAHPHIGKRVVLSMDLEDFFLTIGGARIDALFRTLGYPPAVARTLTVLCTNHVPPRELRPVDPGKYAFELPDLDWLTRKRYGAWHLPQGAPTSPALANLCAFRLDLRLQAAADQFDAAYTRYADDLTFSGGDELRRGIRRLVPLVGAIALEEGLRVNFRKTRVMTSARRQEVTGVVVNRKANLRRDVYDELKATLHNCVRRGPGPENRAGVANFRAHLAAIFARMNIPNRSADRSEAIARAYAHFDDGDFVATLRRRIAIPSSSQEPARAEAMQAYLRDEMTPALAALGFTSRTFDNPIADGPPLLVAERIEDPDELTVLIYGHDTVRGLDDLWRPGLAPWN